MVGKIVSWVVLVLLAGLYAYMVVAAVGNVVLLPEMAAQLGLSVNATGWFWLWLGVALPMLAFVVALVITWRRKQGSRIIVFAAALAATAAIQLEILHLVPQSTFFV